MDEPYFDLYELLEIRRLELLTYLHNAVADLHQLALAYDELDDVTDALHSGDQDEARRILGG